MAPTPITILTGFLGSGKTTLILNLIPQLPSSYKLALLKNEFGDLAIDSQLASSSSISGVRELLNGCICCNLVGQLGEALETLQNEQNPDRIIIETSGSAFPATLALEVNRLSRESNGEKFALDGVVSVIDVENWQGYEDTSVTAKMQAQYTDFVVFNKFELVNERKFDLCLDRLGDLEVQIPWVKSDKGSVSKDVILGIDGALTRSLDSILVSKHHHQDGQHHQSEVDVLSVTLETGPNQDVGLDLGKLESFLLQAPKDEVYRIKAIMSASRAPMGSDGEVAAGSTSDGSGTSNYILNWAFGRWTFTLAPSQAASPYSQPGVLLRMTIITAQSESNKWKKRIEEQQVFVSEAAENKSKLTVSKVA